jgi:hypothetical protein
LGNENYTTTNTTSGWDVRIISILFFSSREKRSGEGVLLCPPWGKETQQEAEGEKLMKHCTAGLDETKINGVAVDLD